LAAEELPRLFRPFSQGDHANETGGHRFGGLGLGLAISKTLAELHSGSITARSEGRGRGATFVVALPLAKGAQGMAPAEPLAPAPGRAGEANRRPTILLVEDHEPTRLVLERILKDRGYAVRAASTIAEARVSAAKPPGIDVLISDLGLPDGSGYDLMAELSTGRPLKGIALSGFGMEHDLAESRRAGFTAHLTKPVRIQMIVDALAEL
jgi:CheY-like chemotaxis protein